MKKPGYKPTLGVFIGCAFIYIELDLIDTLRPQIFNINIAKPADAIFTRNCEYCRNCPFAGLSRLPSIALYYRQCRGIHPEHLSFEGLCEGERENLYLYR